MVLRPPSSSLFPYTTLFRSPGVEFVGHPYTRHMVLTSDMPDLVKNIEVEYPAEMAKIRKALDTGKRSNGEPVTPDLRKIFEERDRKSTRLNSSHVEISYAVF